MVINYLLIILGEYLVNFVALSRRKETLEQIVGDLGGADMKESGKYNSF